MRCPYCDSQIQESTTECPACRLSYPRTCSLLGAVPRMTPLVTDTTHTLRTFDHRRLKQRILGIQKRFPQLVLQIIMHEFPQEHPFSMHVFWLFNAAALTGNNRRGRNSHALMIALDPARGESAIIPGYGLEPFLDNEALEHLLELASPAWEGGRWTDGFLRVLDGLEPWLVSIALPEETHTPTSSDF